jgi:hypothetical protein
MAPRRQERARPHREHQSPRTPARAIELPLEIGQRPIRPIAGDLDLYPVRRRQDHGARLLRGALEAFEEFAGAVIAERAMGPDPAVPARQRLIDLAGVKQPRPAGLEPERPQEPRRAHLGGDQRRFLGHDSPKNNPLRAGFPGLRLGQPAGKPPIIDPVLPGSAMRARIAVSLAGSKRGSSLGHRGLRHCCTTHSEFKSGGKVYQRTQRPTAPSGRRTARRDQKPLRVAKRSR